MKITLQVNGREMTFSEEELIAIVEKHLSSETTQHATTAKVAQKPTVGAWFEVKPQAIDQKLFEKKREENKHEAARQLILEAFAEMKDNPEKYGKNFRTMKPKQTWNRRTVAQLKEMASNLGDHNANWVEQALEWAQRIANGESWEEICTAEFTDGPYDSLNSLVLWKNGYVLIIGGSVCVNNSFPVWYANVRNLNDDDYLAETVPSVVCYE